ncbi:MAG: OmpA family protein [Nitrospira sp.]|jgi:peptidoglycan-associated lipoprotein|nr:OmpA family protein [Nitrospira sp.]
MYTPLHRLIPGCLALLLTIGASGCATKSVYGTGDELIASEERIPEPAIRERTPREPGTPVTRTSPGMRAELSARNATGAERSILSDVLFDFDRATLRIDALPILDANAKRLADEGTKRVLLEGRGDEMGTSAYNLVLGERRAKAVRSYLKQLGLDIDLRTTSYGKDRPLCFEHQQECWQKNRSVHFVVKE